MNKKTNKRGIALISLAVIVAVLMALATIVTYASVDIINEAEKTAFAKDIVTIYEAAQEYYAVNGDIPVLTGGIEMSAETYKSKITDAISFTALSSEITTNQDENAIFYEIDLTKIGIDNIAYGIKENEKDLFLVSNESHLIYYYPGYEINNDIYFSNSYIVSK